jgi:hypothetical protein
MIRPTKKPVTKTELMAKFNVTYNGVAEPKKVESQEVIDERAACAAIAEMVERDKQMPDSMRSVAARIRILIQQRGVK